MTSSHPPRRAPGALCAGLLVAALLAPPALDAQVLLHEYDGFTVEVRQLFAARCDAAWVGVEVVIRNPGSARIEPTIAITSTIAGVSHPRRVEWTTVVSPGSEDDPTVRREMVPVACLGRGDWGGFIAADLEVSLGGARLEPRARAPGAAQLAREQHWRHFGGRNQVVPDAQRWHPWGNFDVLVVAAGEEPAGWRTAFEAEVGPQIISGNGGNEQVVFRALAAEALPVHPEAFEGVDRVVLIGLAPERLSEPQRAALRTAVRLGLRVWLIPDASGAGNEWVWPTALRGIPPRTVAIPESPRVRSHFVAPEGDPGRVRDGVEVDGVEVPLSLIYPEGAGAWLRLTSPVAPWRFRDAPAEGWSARASAEAHAEGTIEDPMYGYNARAVPDRGWISAVDAALRRAVDPLALLLFVLLYLLLAGPGLFVWLKRRGRLPRLLWLQPLVVVVFLAGTGLLGWVHFGVATRSDDTFVLYQVDGEPGGRLVRLSSVYSAMSTRRDLPAGAGTLPVPVPGPSREIPLAWDLDGGERALAGFRTRTWSLTHFVAAVGVELGAVRFEQVGETVALENGLPFPLRFIGFPGPNDARREEEVPAGRTVSFERWLPEVSSTDPIRRELWAWPTERSDLAVRCVAEFDPADLPPGIFPDRAGDARGYLVLLAPERRRR